MMNKKLISLAVAAALAAPAAAMAEATLYGRLGVSIDYAEVKNAIPPSADEMVDVTVYNGQTTVTDNFSFADLYGGVDGDPQYVTDYLDYVSSDELTTTFVNNSGNAVFVPEYVENNEGFLELSRIVEVQSGELYTGATDSFSYQYEQGDFSNVNIVRVDANGNAIVAPGSRGQKFSGWGVNGDAWRKYTGKNGLPQAQGPSNRVGVKGSEDLGNGLKAIYQLEFGVNFGDANIPGGLNDGVSIRNSFVGLAGSFGTVLVGRHDTPLKISTGKLDLFSDTIADYNGTVGFDDIRADNAIAYISPSFSGFSFMGALVAPGSGTAGYGQNINSDQINGAYSLAGIYNNGPFYASAAYESLSAEMFMDSQTSLDGNAACVGANGQKTLTCNYVGDDYDKWRFGLGLLDWNGFTLTGIYEQQDNLPGGQTTTETWFIDPDGVVTRAGVANGFEKQKLWQVQAAYAFGNNMFKAMYGSMDRDEGTRAFDATRQTVSLNNLRNDLSGDRQTWAVGFDHNFSKRTQAYVLYTDVDDDLDGSPYYPGASWSGFSLGMVHKF
jgi:predicted porin